MILTLMLESMIASNLYIDIIDDSFENSDIIDTVDNVEWTNQVILWYSTLKFPVFSALLWWKI